MNLNKLEKRIKELDKFFPLLDSKEEVEMIIASEEFQDEIFKIKKEFEEAEKVWNTQKELYDKRIEEESLVSRSEEIKSFKERVEISNKADKVIVFINNLEDTLKEINKEDLACSFQNIAVDEVVRKLEIAINKTKVSNVILAGGVSANKYLREEMQKLCDKYQVIFHVPNILYCTDNAAMIASAAHCNYICGKSFDIKDKLDLNAIANLKIGE